MNGEQLRTHLHSGARIYGKHIAMPGVLMGPQGSRALNQRRGELCCDHTPLPAGAAKIEVNSCIQP